MHIVPTDSGTHCQELPQDNVVDIGGYTRLPIDPNKMLKNIAKECDIQECLVIVKREDGSFTYHSSTPDLFLDCKMAKSFVDKAFNGDFD